jgi:hypothetical protein
LIRSRSGTRVNVKEGRVNIKANIQDKEGWQCKGKQRSRTRSANVKAKI